jgi:mannose-6-phosphate isomerase-like protein (cupin superfamily)
MLRASIDQMLQRLPGPRTPRWPEGERFVEAFTHGSVVVELYVPLGSDPQQPHDRDEVYFIATGSGEFVLGQERCRFVAGDALFVPAHAVHRFENFSSDFTTWVVFYGPPGGEA